MDARSWNNILQYANKRRNKHFLLKFLKSIPKVCPKVCSCSSGIALHTGYISQSFRILFLRQGEGDLGRYRIYKIYLFLSLLFKGGRGNMRFWLRQCNVPPYRFHHKIVFRIHCHYTNRILHRISFFIIDDVLHQCFNDSN